MVNVTRPLLRWHGGKWRLAPWIIEHFPPHRVYVEPYGGAGSVLMRKPRAYAEVYNDLDRDVVNLFRVLQDVDQALELRRRLEVTPFARDEFELAYRETHDMVERSRRLVIRSYMGFGSDGHNPNARTGFRASSNRSNTTPAQDWANYPDSLVATVERLRGVVVENRPALEVMAQHDGPDTLFYVDPPYMPETRSDKSRKSGERYYTYQHEMTAEDHEALLGALLGLDGMVVLSGYPNTLYRDVLGGWRTIQKQALADGARPRLEVLWLNERAVENLQQAVLL